MCQAQGVWNVLGVVYSRHDKKENFTYIYAFFNCGSTLYNFINTSSGLFYTVEHKIITHLWKTHLP